ncbi:MAG: hypothetical protein ACT4QD_25540, partial [Acidobacteriota bacterium]
MRGSEMSAARARRVGAPGTSITLGVMLVLASAAGSGQTGQTAPARPGGSQEVYVNSVRYSRGQSIQPVFEGWTRNPDG